MDADTTLVPREYLYITPGKLGGNKSYCEMCALLGLVPIMGGYAGLLLEDPVTGERSTYLTLDVDWITGIVADRENARAFGADTGLVVDAAVMTAKLAATFVGWPDTWTGRPTGRYSPDF